MSHDECNPDAREYVLTEKGRRILRWAFNCDHHWVVEGRKLVCKWCSAEYELRRSSFGGSVRDLKG